MRCLQAKHTNTDVTTAKHLQHLRKLAKRLIHVSDKDYFMLHKLLCGFIIVHNKR